MDFTEDFKKVLLNEPQIILGKKGITQEFINHTIKLLKRYKIIKIKALKSIANKSNIKEFASQIAEMTESNVLDIRGFTFIVSKYSINKIE